MTMTNKDTFADMFAKNAARLEKLETALAREAASNSLVSHSWVVVMPLLGCMKFDLTPIRENGRTRYETSNPQPAGSADVANRYTKEDAKTLAADIRNGAGEYGRAMHWTDAALAEIAGLKDVQEMLAQAAA